jgi:hypothetical protein
MGSNLSSYEKEPLTWYRGEHCNFGPTKEELLEDGAVEKFFLKGWTPPAPFMGTDTKVMTFGSCFARHLRNYLTTRNIPQHELKYKRVPIMHAAAGLNTTFTLRQQFEWAWEGRQFDESLWFSEEKEEIPALEKYREETRRVFNETDIFVITLGLSEIWYNKESGDVFWRGIPVHQHDPDIHGFRVSTVQENVDNLNKIISLSKKHRPNAKFIFTLSPVPLKATFRPVGCVTATSVSKSILRVAADEVVRQHAENVYYWPSYEIIKDYCHDPYEEDNRHVKKEVVDWMMDQFSQHYIR